MTAAPLRLGFVRGVAPQKWARRWAEWATHSGGAHAPLELVPLDSTGRIEPTAAAELDVVLERIPPGERPDGSVGPDRRRNAVRLYEEAVALVVAADHELTDTTSARKAALDRDTLELVSLLPHPDHPASWPATDSIDAAWIPRDAAEALALAATGTSGVLLPLPLARHLADKRAHAILPLEGIDPPLPGTEIWASWEIERDANDVQQLIGIFRGRGVRSSRGAR